MRRVYKSTFTMSSLMVICLFTSQACAMRQHIPLFSASPATSVSQNQVQVPSYPSAYGGFGQQDVVRGQQQPVQRQPVQPFKMPPQPQPQVQSSPYYQQQQQGFGNAVNPYQQQQQARKLVPMPPVKQPQQQRMQVPAVSANPYATLMKEAQQCVDVAMEMNDTAYYLGTAKKNGKYFVPVLSSNLEFLKRLFNKFRCERWYGYNQQDSGAEVVGQKSGAVQKQEQEYDYNTYLNVDGY